MGTHSQITNTRDANMTKRVAVVTGSNKGIGFAIVRGLCKQFQGDVILTARNVDLGKKAVSDLNAEGCKPKFHQLDINDQASINALAAFLKQEYGGLDVLVNNAGMAYKQASTAPFSEQAEVTNATNFTGTLNVCNALFPLLRSGARVVNVSSFVSLMSLAKSSQELKKRFTKPDLSMEELVKMIDEFVSAAKVGDHEKKGWPNTTYGVSKMGVTAMSIIQQRDIDKDRSRSDIVINAACPGYVDTDMSSHKGTKTIDEGADTPLYLATLPAGTKSPRGNFLSDRTIKPWQ